MFRVVDDDIEGPSKSVPYIFDFLWPFLISLVVTSYGDVTWAPLECNTTPLRAIYDVIE